MAHECVGEVFHLDLSTRDTHLSELAEVPAALETAFVPSKLNIESLGNTVPHLHWWITPRYADDPRPITPIWVNPDFLNEIWTESGLADTATLNEDAARLRAALAERGLPIL